MARSWALLCSEALSCRSCCVCLSCHALLCKMASLFYSHSLDVKGRYLVEDPKDRGQVALLVRHELLHV